MKKPLATKRVTRHSDTIKIDRNDIVDRLKSVKKQPRHRFISHEDRKKLVQNFFRQQILLKKELETGLNSKEKLELAKLIKSESDFKFKFYGK